MKQKYFDFKNKQHQIRTVIKIEILGTVQKHEMKTSQHYQTTISTTERDYD